MMKSGCDRLNSFDSAHFHFAGCSARLHYQAAEDIRKRRYKPVKLAFLPCRHAETGRTCITVDGSWHPAMADARQRRSKMIGSGNFVIIPQLMHMRRGF